MKRKQQRPRKPREERHAPPEPTGELMTPFEVAQYMGVRMWRVRRWERERYLTPVVRRGERVYIRMEVEHLAAMYGR